ncbi:hypothetical protein PPERSA_05397 [Pseudocohnilembus persalinus]|uniref:Uncharacterized protein n=1 Tax=Pseudocohnilembus persalinus TaxID=266149 RepID=A0A0V0R7V7_PSEPJ|nr:hypothetical protein PPERSA_05397 [Pseudocohnilembus persalinus]|eukprot:KRX10577.1 hypothetical protein PPERSA_05397 [Pseudocohnilembus persalinus]
MSKSKSKKSQDQKEKEVENFQPIVLFNNQNMNLQTAEGQQQFQRVLSEQLSYLEIEEKKEATLLGEQLFQQYISQYVICLGCASELQKFVTNLLNMAEDKKKLLRFEDIIIYQDRKIDIWQDNIVQLVERNMRDLNQINQIDESLYQQNLEAHLKKRSFCQQCRENILGTYRELIRDAQDENELDDDDYQDQIYEDDEVQQHQQQQFQNEHSQNCRVHGPRNLQQQQDQYQNHIQQNGRNDCIQQNINNQHIHTIECQKYNQQCSNDDIQQFQNSCKVHGNLYNNSQRNQQEQLQQQQIQQQQNQPVKKNVCQCHCHNIQSNLDIQQQGGTCVLCGCSKVVKRTNNIQYEHQCAENISQKQAEMYEKFSIFENDSGTNEDMSVSTNYSNGIQQQNLQHQHHEKENKKKQDKYIRDFCRKQQKMLLKQLQMKMQEQQEKIQFLSQKRLDLQGQIQKQKLIRYLDNLQQDYEKLETLKLNDQNFFQKQHQKKIRKTMNLNQDNMEEQYCDDDESRVQKKIIKKLITKFLKYNQETAQYLEEQIKRNIDNSHLNLFTQLKGSDKRVLNINDCVKFIQKGLQIESKKHIQKLQRKRKQRKENQGQNQVGNEQIQSCQEGCGVQQQKGNKNKKLKQKILKLKLQNQRCQEEKDEENQDQGEDQYNKNHEKYENQYSDESDGDSEEIEEGEEEEEDEDDDQYGEEDEYDDDDDDEDEDEEYEEIEYTSYLPGPLPGQNFTEGQIFEQINRQNLQKYEGSEGEESGEEGEDSESDSDDEDIHNFTLEGEEGGEEDDDYDDEDEEDEEDEDGEDDGEEYEDDNCDFDFQQEGNNSVLKYLRYNKEKRKIIVPLQKNIFNEILQRSEMEIKAKHANNKETSQQELLICLGKTLKDQIQNFWKKKKSEEIVKYLFLKICSNCLLDNIQQKYEKKLSKSGGYQTILEEYLQEQENAEESKKEKLRKKKERKKEKKRIQKQQQEIEEQQKQQQEMEKKIQREQERKGKQKKKDEKEQQKQQNLQKEQQNQLEKQKQKQKQQLMSQNNSADKSKQLRNEMGNQKISNLISIQNKEQEMEHSTTNDNSAEINLHNQQCSQIYNKNQEMCLKEVDSQDLDQDVQENQLMNCEIDEEEMENLKVILQKKREQQRLDLKNKFMNLISEKK